MIKVTLLTIIEEIDQIIVGKLAQIKTNEIICIIITSMITAPATLLIFLTVIRYTQSIVCSGATPKQYSGACYATCAAASVSYEYRNKCYDICPNTTTVYAPFDYQHICYPNCPWIPPNVTYAEITSCVTRCTTGFADDSTRMCVADCPQDPILTFKDTNRNKCVRMCSTNPSEFANLNTKTCVADCPPSTWGEPDTRKCLTTCPVGTFYQQFGTAHLCVYKCYPNYYARLDRVCVNALGGCPTTPIMYYGDDLSNMCVQECPYNSSTYAEDSTQKCVFFCSLGTFADDISKKCLHDCPLGPPRYYGSNITRECHLQCNEGQFADDNLSQCVKVCTGDTYGDYSTRKCVPVCPTSQGTFGDPLTRLCVKMCSPRYYADNDTRLCVVSTDCSRRYVGDPLTLKCIPAKSCPIGYFADMVNKICVTRCPVPYWGQLNTRRCELFCQWIPPGYLSWYDPSTRICIKKCPSNPRTFGLNTTRRCVSICPSGYFGSVVTYQCVKTCPDGYTSQNVNRICVADCNTNSSFILYNYPPNTTCIDSCPQDWYADNQTMSCVRTCPEQTYGYDGNNTCLAGCPEDLYADNHSQRCVEACPAVTLEYADDSTNMCVKKCPVVPDYFGEDINNAHRKCVPMCTLTSKYADPITRTCVSKCNVAEGYFGYQPNRRCYLTCPAGYGNPFTTKCVSRCPQTPYQTFGDNSTMTCVKTCSNQTYGDKVRQLCVFALDCPANTFADDDTQLCIPKCSSFLNLFGDPVTRKCVKSCPFPYFADNTTRKCQPNCNSTSWYYKDPSTKRCVDICPTMPDLYADTTNMSCVDKCSNGKYRLTYSNTVTTTRKCVTKCPSSPVYYADQQTKTCVRQCANQTYLFYNNSYRGCVKICPPQIYTSTYSVDLYADNTTWKCVSVCPPLHYALKHPTNTSVRLCVKMCVVIDGVYYFAEAMSRKCVTACPLRLYGTYGDRISLTCGSTCSRQQFRDNVTKQCQYECSDGYFADNTTWNCVKKCPNGTFAESINKTCVKYCPTDYYAYTKTNQCVEHCEHWRYYADNTTWKCVTECPSDPDYYAHYNSRTCVLRCPDGWFASNNTVTTSALRYCAQSNRCVSPKVADPIFNRCSPRCTIDPMFYAMPDTKLCGPDCFNGLFADNTTGLCVTICPSPYFGVNSTTYFTCVQYCPTDQFKLTPGRMCVAQCPEGLFSDNLTMSCVSECPDQSYGRQSDNTCVYDCQPQYRDDNSKQCKSRCPLHYTASNNSYMCQWKCDYGEYEYDRVCYSSCQAFGLFADNLTRKCLSGCPDDPWTYADTTNHTCEFKCDGGLFAFQPNRTCLPSCPPGYFMQYNGSLCLDVCLEGHYADLNTSSCVVDCLADNYTFINPFNRTCVTKCPQDPDLYGFQNHTCIEHCPVGWYAENVTRTCMQVCPNDTDIFNSSWADDLTHRCVQRCSALSYAYSNETANLCVNFCPDGWFASEIEQSCVQVCPNDTFAHNDSHTCVDMCPNGQFGDIHTKICSSQCHFNNSEYKDNSTNMCVEQCPDNPSMYAQDSTRQCVLTCQIGFYGYTVNRTCIQTCPDPYFIDNSSSMCVLACPIDSDTFADSQINTCTPTCTNYTMNYTVNTTFNGTYNQTLNSTTVMFYADKSTLRCVEVCPERPQKLYGLNASNICVKSCPDGTFGDNDTRLCLDKCIFQEPKYTWQDYVNYFCVTLCPLNYFADNRTFSCEQECTTGFFADNSTRRCVVTCPVQPASYGLIAEKTCVYFCPDGLFADQISRNCIPVCPTTPFVYYHYKPTNKCVRQCIHPYFAEVSSLYCVRKCQDGFYGNLTTHKCQTCKVECVTCSAYLECLSCVSGFFLYKFECVTECPSYPVMYFAHIQSGICFLSCPSPYFGQTNTGLCHLSCPVLYYGDLVSRVCKHCPDGCLTCDIDGCYDCLTDYVYVQSSVSCSSQCNSTHIYFWRQQCYTACPDGSYLSVLDLVTCLPCSTECATCSIIAGNCTKCAFKFFYNYRCVDACPSNYFVDNNLACVACSLYPERCTLPPLTYTISPFTKNFQLHAYVVFNRVVNMTLDQFQRTVQIKYNGQVVRPSNFSVQFYNKTTYWVTFRNSSSLNQNALSIGFQPGFIVDMFGNQLTVNQVSSGFKAETGVNQQIANNTNKLSTATNIISWILLALVLLFLIKSGYPFLITIECAQIFYMFTFIRLDPIPYIQLQFLKALKNVHFLFLPSFFPGPTGYIIKQYESFLTNSSMLYNASPFIAIVGFVGIIYFLFFVLSSKKIISNKRVRQVSKKIRKYRLKYGILNDAIWFVYIYAIFMAMLQFGQASTKTTWDTINVVFSAFVFSVLLVYTGLMIFLGNKYKDPAKKLPTKWEFLRYEPSHFPMQMAMRYIRKFLFCCALLLNQPQSQCIVIIVCCFLFLMYLLCYKPSESSLTNGINVTIETSYIVLAGMYYGYKKLQNKSLDEQVGFSIALITIKTLVLLIVIGWTIYRGILVIRSTQTWQNAYVKMTENKSPEYLREQQKKRDLQFDWGQFENRSDQDKTQQNIFESSSRNMKNEKANIFDVKEDDDHSEFIKQKDSKSHKFKESNSSYDGSFGSQQNVKFKPNRTQKIQKPRKKGHLEINNADNSRDVSQLDLKSVDSKQELKPSKEPTQQIKIETEKPKQRVKAIWDDIEFDEHQI